MRVLDLFSGIGGFSLGLERAGMTTVAFCEIEPFCRAVLRKHWPDVPQFEDVRKLRGEDVGPVELVAGGYPCQPFSTAGERRGAEDDRHLWPEMCRLVEELRPTWVLGENVAGHVSMGLDQVLSDLEALGYSTQAFIIPACAIGTLHRRDRVWVVANASSKRLEKQGGVGFASSAAEEGNRETNHALDGGWWSVEPGMGRVAPRVPNRVDRLKALGNAVVPQVVEIIGRAIMQAEAA